MTTPTPEQRNRYPHFLVIPTRWMDNDVYGHVNNVIYFPSSTRPWRSS